MQASLDGIHVALVTPFDNHENVDDTNLANLVEDQIDNGVHGVVVNGSTGEFPALTPDERRRTVEIVTDAARGRVPITVQVGAMTTREALQHAEHASRCGAFAVMLVPPHYEHVSETELVQYVQAIATVGVPVMLYNNPGATCWSMTPETIARLAEIDGVKYLKDTTGDARRLFRIRELVGDRLEMLNGQDTLALLGFLAGTRGTVWGAPNVAPRACVRLWEMSVQSPDLVAARDFWSVFYPLNRFLEDEGYIAAVKAGTNLRGVHVGVPRRPILALAQDRVRELERLMQRVDEALKSPRLAAATA